MADYLLRYLNPQGIFIDNITDFARLEYAAKENEVGVMTLSMSPNLITPMIDGRFEIQRKVGAGAFNLEFDTQWFIRSPEDISETVDRLEIKAYSATELITRRIIAYAADTPQTNKTAHIDDMMKAIMRENFGTLAIAARNISTYFSIQADNANAPITTKAASWKNVLPVLQELAETSFNLGTYLVFDVVRLTDIQLEFRTYIGQRGINRGSTGASPLLVSKENGALSKSSVLKDYSSEGNYAYCGGRGEGIDRYIGEAEDTTRSLATVINRREVFKDARMTEENSKIDDEAEELLNASRPKIIFTGTLTDTDGIVYGINYNYGDIVEAQHKDTVMDCHVNSVHVTVEGGSETLDIQLRGETYV